jgi:hypothetical protein
MRQITEHEKAFGSAASKGVDSRGAAWYNESGGCIKERKRYFINEVSL